MQELGERLDGTLQMKVATEYGIFTREDEVGLFCR